MSTPCPATVAFSGMTYSCDWNYDKDGTHTGQQHRYGGARWAGTATDEDLPGRAEQDIYSEPSPWS